MERCLEPTSLQTSEDGEKPKRKVNELLHLKKKKPLRQKNQTYQQACRVLTRVVRTTSLRVRILGHSASGVFSVMLLNQLHRMFQCQ
ncbi:hypothetical protein Y032_0033g2632 [Ancylostoma ceylanicum]|uniref:Uncharacterized protein n=1 Tax=Ancylostoma ceylanicum TaxID=53326 RepID=A0A016UMH4_9BILA|nr:hypothetical protein Y032_0033g2632 [Ancylostoma ceylanicum]